MGIRVPRITVNADFGDDTAFGDLSLLSVGYGLHQAWVYAVMFGTPTIFGTPTVRVLTDRIRMMQAAA